MLMLSPLVQIYEKLFISPSFSLQLGSLPDSLHLPFSSSFEENPDSIPPASTHGDFFLPDQQHQHPKWQLVPEARDSLALRRKGLGQNAVVVVCGGSARPREAQDFAERLLAAGHSRVCVLHRGVEEAFSRVTPGVLCVPDA